jgi:hypothetical protein
MAPSQSSSKANIVYEIMRFITPTGMAIVLAFVTNINAKIDRLDDKVFKHLTNDEIHAPRSMFVEKTNFDMYQKMRDAQIATNDRTIQEIKTMIYDMSCSLRESVKKKVLDE